MTLGEKLSTLRKNYGLTQTQLGEKLNLSAQAVSKWENNLAEPDITTLKKLALIYGVSIEEIVNASSNDNTAEAEPSAVREDEAAECMQLLIKNIQAVTKIQTIKLIMDTVNLPEYCFENTQYPSLGLNEAKNAVENLPFVMTFEDKADLEAFKKNAAQLGCEFDQVTLKEKSFFIKEYIVVSQKTREELKNQFREENKGLLKKHFIVSTLLAFIPVAVCLALFLIFGCEQNVLRNGIIFLAIAYVLFSFVFQYRYDSVPMSIILGSEDESAFAVFFLFIVAIAVSPFTFPVSFYKRLTRMRANDVDEILYVKLDKIMRSCAPYMED